jgi:hypothetical protein
MDDLDQLFSDFRIIVPVDQMTRSQVERRLLQLRTVKSLGDKHKTDILTSLKQRLVPGVFDAVTSRGLELAAALDSEIAQLERRLDALS